MPNDPFDDSQQQKSANDFFDGGAPSCQFQNIGDTHQGEIIDFEEAQQRDIQTGKPKSWPDGNPCMMLVVTIQTAHRADPDDDGKRRLYVNKPGGIYSAILAAKGKNKFAIGGKIAIKYTGNGKPKQPGFSPPKEYAARYAPPSGETSAAQPQQPYPRTAESIKNQPAPANPLSDEPIFKADDIPF